MAMSQCLGIFYNGFCDAVLFYFRDGYMKVNFTCMHAYLTPNAFTGIIIQSSVNIVLDIIFSYCLGNELFSGKLLLFTRRALVNQKV